MLVAPIAASASGDNLVVAAAAGYKYRVLGFLLSFGGTVNAKWRSGANDLTGLVYGVLGAQATSPQLPAGAGAIPQPLFVTNPGEALNLNLSGGVGVGGLVLYEKLAAGQ